MFKLKKYIFSVEIAQSHVSLKSAEEFKNYLLQPSCRHHSLLDPSIDLVRTF